MNALGDCFRFAYDLQQEHPGRSLCHGTIRHPWDGTRFAHAWVTDGKRVWDWQGVVLRKETRGLSAKVWTERFKPILIACYTRDEALLNAARFRHYGPWT